MTVGWLKHGSLHGRVLNPLLDMGRFFQRFYNDEEPVVASVHGVFQVLGLDMQTYMCIYSCICVYIAVHMYMCTGDNTYIDIYRRVRMCVDVRTTKVYCCAACGAHFAQYKVLHVVAHMSFHKSRWEASPRPKPQ